MDSVLQYPILDIKDKIKRQTIKELTKDLILSKEKLCRLQYVFNEEMDLGLALTPGRKSSLLMQNTFVPEMPNGLESGYYLSLDLGTTNFRVVLSHLEPEVDNEFTVEYYDIPIECRKGDSKNLFDFLAVCVEDFVHKFLPNYEKRLSMGFTFSFPMTMKSLNVGILQTWTKNFDCKDAVGVDCARLLQEAIGRRPQLNVDVVAILNDSTGTLVNGVYLDSNCAIGMILGTGYNMCYIERADRIEKWTDRCESVYADVEEVVINTECGGFGDNGCIDFVKTGWDVDLDRQSLFPNSFTFEKYFSGHYIGDIVRRVLLSLAQNNCLFNGHISEELTQINAISSSDLSLIEGNKNESKIFCKELAQRLGYSMISDEDVSIIRYTSALVSVRAALLLSAIIAALVDRMDRSKVTIAIDGSVYKFHPKFHQLMTDFTQQLLNTKKTFKLFLAEDGSGKGAGLVAAIAHRFLIKHNNNNIFL